jgi:hypothetical protein
VQRSFEVTRFMPQDTAQWDAAAKRFEDFLA